MREGTEPSESIVEASNYRALPGELGPRVGRGRSTAVDKPPAVDPHDYRQQLRAALGRSPNIEVKTVFRRFVAGPSSINGIQLLHAVAAEGRGVANSVPRVDGLRRTPSQVTEGWRRIGDALPACDAAFLAAPHCPGVGGHDARVSDR